MSDNQKLRDALQLLFPQKGYNEFAYVKVTSVNEKNRTFDAVSILYENEHINDIKMRVYEGGEAVNYLSPVVGSKVLIGFISKEDAHLLWVSEPDKIVVDANSIVLNGGQLGGIVVWQKLEAELQKINTFMQLLLSVTNIPTIPEPGNGAPSAFHAALKTAMQAAQVPNYQDITDEKIKH